MKLWPIAQPAYESADGLGMGTPEPVAAEPVTDDEGSLSDHEASFGPEAKRAERAAPTEDAADGERDGKTGQFKPRHRAASQRADADDVPTINAHTKRIKEAEARLGADIVKQDGESERAFTLRRRAELLERQAAPATAARREEPAAPRREAEPAKAAAKLPEKFPTHEEWLEKPENVDKSWYDYSDERSAHNYAVLREKERADETARETQRREQTALNDWYARHDAFAATDPTFATIAGPFIARLETGTLLGDAIVESKVGPQLAKHLATHPEDVERLAGLSVNGALREIGKIEALYDTPVASQRPTPTRTAADSTRAARATPPIAPKPPTLVRTGVSRDADALPGDESSLAEHEAAYGRRKRA